MSSRIRKKTNKERIGYIQDQKKNKKHIYKFKYIYIYTPRTFKYFILVHLNILSKNVETMASLVTEDITTTTTTTTRRRRTTTTATETSEQMTENELSHFEDLPGILQICIGTSTKPGLIAYFDDDILAMINMFAKTCKKFLEYDPLRCYYFRVVLTKKYGVNFDDSEVILDGKNIHDEDLQNVGEALKANNTLTYLDLDNNNITDVQSIGELLKTNNTLTVLYLHNNNITDVQSIGEGLKTNNTLETLHLSNNNITDVQSIGEALKANNTITYLDLDNNNITDVQSHW